MAAAKSGPPLQEGSNVPEKVSTYLTTVVALMYMALNLHFAEMQMSSSMYEVVHWGNESDTTKPLNPPSPSQAIKHSTSLSFGINAAWVSYLLGCACVCVKIGDRRDEKVCSDILHFRKF